MKTFEETRALATKVFEENFSAGVYSDIEKGLFTSGFTKGYMVGIKTAISELTSKHETDQNPELLKKPETI